MYTFFSQFNFIEILNLFSEIFDLVAYFLAEMNFSKVQRMPVNYFILYFIKFHIWKRFSLLFSMP